LRLASIDSSNSTTLSIPQYHHQNARIKRNTPIVATTMIGTPIELFIIAFPPADPWRELANCQATDKWQIVNEPNAGVLALDGLVVAEAPGAFGCVGLRCGAVGLLSFAGDRTQN
jgi:hypothetical protein